METLIDLIAQVEAGRFGTKNRSVLLQGLEAMKAPTFPYSVSEWEKIGKERGYWKFFEEKLREEPRMATEKDMIRMTEKIIKDNEGGWPAKPPEESPSPEKCPTCTTGGIKNGVHEAGAFVFPGGL